MEAAPVHITQQFAGPTPCVTPLFQRPYSWEAKDWNTLWDDMMAQCEVEERSSKWGRQSGSNR